MPSRHSGSAATSPGGAGTGDADRAGEHEEGSDPYIRVGTVAVYVGGHEFDDDDIASPEGSDIALRSEYPAMIEVRDTSGDQQRQQEIAGKIFAALESAGRWRAVYIDDMQKVLDTYDPAQ